MWKLNNVHFVWACTYGLLGGLVFAGGLQRWNVIALIFGGLFIVLGFRNFRNFWRSLKWGEAERRLLCVQEFFAASMGIRYPYGGKKSG